MRKQFEKWWKKYQGKTFDARLGEAAKMAAWAAWKAAKLVALFLFLAGASMAQTNPPAVTISTASPDTIKLSTAPLTYTAPLTPLTPPQVLPSVPADVPVTHVSISASFNGYDSNGKMVPANIDTLGIAIFRNAAATQGFNVAYEHIGIPDLGQRWELGLGSYWFTLPKVKGILFDTSNFVVTLSAGAGKLLSASDGNHLAYTVSPSVTYPIAGHMAWTVSYQYVRATGGIAGLVNRSYSAAGTGPAIFF